MVLFLLVNLCPFCFCSNRYDCHSGQCQCWVMMVSRILNHFPVVELSDLLSNACWRPSTVGPSSDAPRKTLTTLSDGPQPYNHLWQSNFAVSCLLNPLKANLRTNCAQEKFVNFERWATALQSSVAIQLCSVMLAESTEGQSSDQLRPGKVCQLWAMGQNLRMCRSNLTLNIHWQLLEGQSSGIVVLRVTGHNHSASGCPTQLKSELTPVGIHVVSMMQWCSDAVWKQNCELVRIDSRAATSKDEVQRKLNFESGMSGAHCRLAVRKLFHETNCFFCFHLVQGFHLTLVHTYRYIIIFVLNIYKIGIILWYII